MVSTAITAHESCFGDAVDLAFLDGLHLFECVLRDFINSRSTAAAPRS
jgi:hypothetical protein